MQLSDYKCTKCKKIFEFEKEKAIDSFPSKTVCPECGGVSKRIYSFAAFSVCEGLAGNSKTNYAKSVTYHTNSLVPNPKGIKIK